MSCAPKPPACPYSHSLCRGEGSLRWLLLAALYVTMGWILWDRTVLSVRSTLSGMPPRSITMSIEIVGLRFKPAGKILQYATNGLALYRGEKCVAESDNGLELATVVLAPHAVD